MASPIISSATRSDSIRTGPRPISPKCSTVNGRSIAAGGSEMDKTSLISFRRRTGKAGNGKRNVGMGLFDRALRHGNSDFAAHRSADINLFPANTQQLALRLLAIYGKAPLERMACPLDIGQQRGEQTARTTFRRCKP